MGRLPIRLVIVVLGPALVFEVVLHRIVVLCACAFFHGVVVAFVAAAAASVFYSYESYVSPFLLVFLFCLFLVQLRVLHNFYS